MTTDEVIATLESKFGKGAYTSGIHAILLHNELPATFDKSNWADWFFKPAPAAFALAKRLGIIKRAGKADAWEFTALGANVRDKVATEYKAENPS